MREQDLFEQILKEDVLPDAQLVEELSALAYRYPYCQTLWVMVAKKMQQMGHIDFSDALQHAALYSGDRVRLHRHSLEAMEFLKDRITQQQQAQKRKENLQELLSQPSDPTNEQENEAQRVRILGLIRQRLAEIEHPDSYAFSFDTEPQREMPIGKNSSDLDQKTALIDDFINKHASIKRSSVAESVPLEEDFEPETTSEEFVSETLADIYIKQGYIEKAINCFQKLILKFPEKSSYFADRIKSIEKK